MDKLIEDCNIRENRPQSIISVLNCVKNYVDMSSKRIELLGDYIEELIKSAEEFGAASSIAKIGEYKGWEVNLQISKNLPKGN